MRISPLYLYQLKAVLRSRHVAPIAVTMIALAMLIVPINAVLNHYDAVAAMVGKRVGSGAISVSVVGHGPPPPKPPAESLLVLCARGTIEVAGERRSVIVYAVSDPSLAEELGLMRIRASGGALIGRSLAGELQGANVARLEVGGVALELPIKGVVEGGGGVEYSVVIPWDVAASRGVEGLLVRVERGGRRPGPAYSIVKFTADQLREVFTAWAVPIYLLACLLSFLNSARLVADTLPYMRTLRAIGMPLRPMALSTFAGIAAVSAASAMAGMSAGVVATQVAAKVIYWLSGVVMYPHLELYDVARILALLCVPAAAGAAAALVMLLPRGLRGVG